jgi:hypothetical protein
MKYVFLPALPVKKLFSGICCARRARQIPAIPHFWNEFVPKVQEPQKPSGFPEGFCGE